MTQKEEVQNFLHSWKEGVIDIGKVFLEGGDYQNCAEEFLSKHYAFDTEEVLFKPTFTKEVIFRNTKDLALSYFVKGDIQEDNGFALKPWEKIELDELTILEEESYFSNKNHNFSNIIQRLLGKDKNVIRNLNKLLNIIIKFL